MTTIADLEALRAVEDAATEALTKAKAAVSEAGRQWAEEQFAAIGASIGSTFTRENRIRMGVTVTETWRIRGPFQGRYNKPYRWKDTEVAPGKWEALVRCELLTKSGEPHKGRGYVNIGTAAIAEGMQP